MISAEDLAKLIAERFLNDPAYFSLWESFGFHLTPVHFYSPIPTLSALPNKLWNKPSDLAGIDVNEQGQLDFLDKICLPFKREYDAFPADATDCPYDYYFNQMMFRAVDAEVLYSILRHFHPKKVIEVGSGFSSLVTASALQFNSNSGTAAEFTAIEPYPNDFLKSGLPGLSRLIQEPVQNIPLDLFMSLKENDVLFIDSSHVVKIGSDVLFLILEVLPKLNPGVIVHFHDIFLPNEYPQQWVKVEHRFWSEQYLLQAFLANNCKFGIMWAGSYMRAFHSKKLKDAFASFDPETVWPGSFWIQRHS